MSISFVDKIMNYNFLIMVQIKHGIAGGLAGITIDMVFYPLQTIKTRIMASSPNQNLKSIALSRFRGFSCQMIVSFPYSFSFFAVYETIRQNSSKSILANAFASVCAEVVGNLIKNPFEVIKQQMMVGRSNQIWQSLLDIKKNQGLKGFYIGFKPTLIRDMVFSAIQFPTFQYIMAILMQRKINSIVSASIAGFIAACIAGFISCPLDVLKTRLMTQKMNETKSRNIFKQIYNEYGLKGFFRGVGFRCGILSFGGIIYFGSLQKFRNLLGIH